MDFIIKPIMEILLFFVLIWMFLSAVFSSFFGRIVHWNIGNEMEGKYYIVERQQDNPDFDYDDFDEYYYLDRDLEGYQQILLKGEVLYVEKISFVSALGNDHIDVTLRFTCLGGRKYELTSLAESFAAGTNYLQTALREISADEAKAYCQQNQVKQ